jgi:hypothetical protein
MPRKPQPCRYSRPRRPQERQQTDVVRFRWATDQREAIEKAEKEFNVDGGG